MGYLTCTKGQATKLSAYFNSTEMDCHGSGCCSTTLINETLIEYLTKIREHFGKPVTITSGYRCPAHNKNVGGATGSRHSKGDAADIVVGVTAPSEVAKYAESIGIKGIGLYETSSDGYFVHIDTRTTKYFWYGQSQTYRSTFGGSTVASDTTSTETSNNTTTGSTYLLTKGDTGSAVKELQQKLIGLGYSCGGYGADGEYGAATVSAVKLFQNEYGGIGVDGIAGYQTLAAVDKAVAVNAYRVKVTASALNVRSGAGTGYKVMSTVRKGATYLVLEETNGWGKVSRLNGWFSLQYVQKL